MENIFSYDCNEAVKDIQYMTKSQVISSVISMAIMECKKASNILQKSADYAKDVSQKYSERYYLYPFDDIFALMAAYFRFKYYPYYPLFKEKVDTDTCLAKWWAFVNDEITWFSHDSEFIRSLLVYFAYGDKHHPITVSDDVYTKYIADDSVNIDYQENVIDCLKSRYKAMFDWQKPKDENCDTANNLSG